jgi:lipopolysaccharide/colanic/teichoic acid biosynthesis glycosyltransferase
MHVDQSDYDGNSSATRADPRVTRVGAFIRRTSIDELPQLLNVVLGDMSLVGPRPHALGSLAGQHLFWDVDEQYWRRHSLRPGITGLAQIRGFRGATENHSDLEDRLRCDLEYLANWSLMRDVQILFATIGVVVHDKAF